jgi:hypothetical protein
MNFPPGSVSVPAFPKIFENSIQHSVANATKRWCSGGISRKDKVFIMEKQAQMFVILHYFYSKCNHDGKVFVELIQIVADGVLQSCIFDVIQFVQC